MQNRQVCDNIEITWWWSAWFTPAPPSRHIWQTLLLTFFQIICISTWIITNTIWAMWSCIWFTSRCHKIDTNVQKIRLLIIYRSSMRKWVNTLDAMFDVINAQWATRRKELDTMMTWSNNKLWWTKTSTFGRTLWWNKTTQLQVIWSTIRDTSIAIYISTIAITKVLVCVNLTFCLLIKFNNC